MRSKTVTKLVISTDNPVSSDTSRAQAPRKDSPNSTYVIIDYCARVADHRPPLCPADDADDARWVEIAKLSEFHLTDGLLPVVPQALSVFMGTVVTE